MSSSVEPEITKQRWTDTYRRADGCQIMAGLTGWLIMPGDEGLPLDACPCCGEPFMDVATAKRVADFVYPMK